MKKIDALNKRKEKLEEEIRCLEETDTLKRYKELLKYKKEIDDDIYNQYKKIGFKKYDDCNQIFIKLKRRGEQNKIRTYEFRGCIKCGLNQISDSSFLEGKIMREYLSKNNIYTKKYINEYCNLNLARLIYLKLKENNLANDDETLIKNFISVVDSLIDENEFEVDEQIKLLLK